MWIMARYLPVAPFSLKPANATSSGGKTLLAPTPYALKMALLDAALRTLGLAEGERLFPFIRDLPVAIDLPHDLVVMKGFSKIRRPVESKDSQKKDETREAFEVRLREKEAARHELGQYPHYSTIAYREYVYYRDAFVLAFALPDASAFQASLIYLLARINYVGKRGGFIQLLKILEPTEQLPADQFVELTANAQASFYRNGTLQVLDDCAPSLSFQQVSIYSTERITLAKDRVLRHIVLPYQLERSSRSYSWYQRIPEEVS